MDTFSEVYGALNSAQREAADTIDGPLLVIAGPGTGKTQLLSARVANILKKTDTPAKNILCLTFTENGAENMRERLSRFISKDAYDVTINTYHAFGGDLIRRYPEYFRDIRLQNPIDELGQRQIIAEIVEHLSYTNPLRQTRHHLGDLISTISEVKRALLSPQDLRLIAAENLLFIQQASRDIKPLLSDFTRMPKANSALSLFEKILQVLVVNAPETPVNRHYGSLAQSAILSLKQALQDANEGSTTTPLTAWKNDWLLKDSDNKFSLAGELDSKRLQALASVIESYQAALAARNLYDFDDMIIRAVETLEKNDDLRFNLQEQYLYILLDEYQDTNAAQARLVQLLSDNPVSEGRPNIMAVGDDDQAIYAFQGALYSNMLDFYYAYKDVKVINLTENYRSHADILYTASNIASLITERLYTKFDSASKALTAASSNMPANATITRREFLSDIAQADWIARQAKALIEQGIPAKEIAVLAPKHRQLEALVPYFNALDIPVRYEKRDNILEARVVKQLLAMTRLVLALHNGDEAAASHLWPEVLSYDFWRIPVSSIWDIAWQVADSHHKNSSGSPGEQITWSRALLASGKKFRVPALLFLSLANITEEESCENMLDYLIGSSMVDTHEADLPKVYSPLRDYYTSDEMREQKPELFYETLSHLTVLRARLRDHQATTETALTLQDLIDFVDMYVAADERMLNSSPYNQQTDAVQLMTVYKAKGLEFSHVIMPYLQDEVWGSTSHGQGNRLTLPINLMPIRHAGSTDDERLRLLFVAITRAKVGLHLTSVAQTFSGKTIRRLKYFDEHEDANGVVRTFVLPEHAQEVIRDDIAPPSKQLLELDWHRRHMAATMQPELQALLTTRLSNYQLSPTHLGTFLDVIYGGPQRFFFNTILRFPEAPTLDSQFGNAIHETLEWIQQVVKERGNIPIISEVLARYDMYLRAKKLTAHRHNIELERGEAALAAYLSSRSNMFTPQDKAEVNFKYEGVFVGDVHLNGKIDRLEIDQAHKTITVVDYKTGKSFMKWLSDPKLYKYRRQLYCYKLLVENSNTYADYTVTKGRLEFIEPDNENRIRTLELSFNDQEMEQVKALLAAMWIHVKQLAFPDISGYSATLSGIKQFEQDLIEQRI